MAALAAPPKMTRSRYWILAAAGLALLGWAGWQWQRSPAGTSFEVRAADRPGGAGQGATGSGSTRPADDPVPSTPRGAGPSAPARVGAGAPVAVEAAQARAMALARTVSAVGTLRAAEAVIVRPEIAGRIARIGFDGGARVRKGDLLVELDAAVLAAEVEQVRAELSLARANYQRTADLAQQQFVSVRARDEAAASLQVLEARLALGQARLSKTRIRAPFDGVLGLRNVSIGDYVREGDILVVLEDVSSMQVDLRLPERFLGQLKTGQALRVAFDAWPGRTFDARLEAIDVRIDADGRALIARGRLPNADRALRTGMFAKASIVLSENPAAVMVPEEAITPAGADLTVYRIDDGKAYRTKVMLGERRDGLVEVVEGLAANAWVVTAGQLKLQRDGQVVRIIDAPVSGAVPESGRSEPGAASSRAAGSGPGR